MRHRNVPCSRLLALLQADYLTLGHDNAVGASEVSWIVQVSDLHLSRFTRNHLKHFGDKEGDFAWVSCALLPSSIKLIPQMRDSHFVCRLFSELVLPALSPGAIVLSGDLVDGKDEQGRGQQQIKEWEVRPIWKVILKSTATIWLLRLEIVRALYIDIMYGHNSCANSRAPMASGC